MKCSKICPFRADGEQTGLRSQTDCWPRAQMKLIPFALLTVLVAGCASHDVNPAKPKAKVGYVDFYTDSYQSLSWRVKRAEEQNGELVEVFLKYTPLEGNILRLATPAGTNLFEVWFMNQLTTGPQPVLVPVVKGKVTPVRVTLSPAKSGIVRTQTYEYRTTRRGVRQVARNSSADQQALEIDLAAALPQEYQPKEQMAYFAQKSK